ncbi:MAG: pyrroline-5-carboxylate reductase [Roseitalea porphyridii]|uniref:pyrroline-5-carboxylate reductase n=1 Tax=Roseitalea porphyridii TaxID=1852022 RepID=UPI0032D99DC6
MITGTGLISQPTSVVLAGCGNMGFAMLRGWLATGTLKPQDVHVVEPLDALLLRADGQGVNTYSTAAALPDDLMPDIVIFAVKPQVIGDVIGDYLRFSQPGRATTFVSVAAGVPIARFERELAPGAPVIRVMPNTPAAVGEGAMVMCANAHVTDRQRKTVERLMAASGEVTEIGDEALMDAVTAVSGSGPAYVFHLIEALTEAGKAVGLPDDIAGRLALQTVHGAARYAHQSGEDPGTLREQVTSPNGTTAAALGVLMRPDGLAALLQEAVRAARDRAIELGR